MINVSHPGRYGDLLWALPTVRALAAQHGPVRLHLPVDPANTTPMIAIAPLLEQQPYIGEVVIRQDWSIEQEAPRRPRYPLPEYRLYGDGSWFNLGYREWPTAPLPFYTAQLAGLEFEPDWSPWITAPRLHTEPGDLVLYHWSDRWFELKYGLTNILSRTLPVTAWTIRVSPQTERWDVHPYARRTSIRDLAYHIAGASIVVTDCSMAHVLAAAMGKRCVVVEPEDARHHFIFWPGSLQDERGHWHQADNDFGRLIYPVIGGDGKPSFDARHTADLIKELLRG